MSGQNATSDPSQALLERLLGWLPAWLGFVLIIAAGIAAIVVGAILPKVGLIAFGVAAILSSALAWWQGASSEPRVNPFDQSFGGVVSKIDGWAWLVVFGLFVVAAIITIVT